MTTNYDQVAYDSRLPAFRNLDSGSFTITISDTIAAGVTGTYTAPVTFAHPNRMIRYSMQQSAVSTDSPYTVSERLPISMLGGSGASLAVYLPCSVSGNPAVVSINPRIYLTSALIGATVTVSINNPYAGTMTVPNVMMTIYYTAFATIGET